jgi:hypothetical protein
MIIFSIRAGQASGRPHILTFEGSLFAGQLFQCEHIKDREENMSETFTSNNDEPAVHAINTSTGAGVFGEAQTGFAVRGNGIGGPGVHGESKRDDGVQGISSAQDHAGVHAINNGGGEAVRAETTPTTGNTPAIRGINKGTGDGVWGESIDRSSSGVAGGSVNGIGVHGANHSELEAAIFGINDTPGKTVPDGSKAGAGSGVWGHTRVEKGAGVVGSVEPGLSQAVGLLGLGDRGAGVAGLSRAGDGVRATSTDGNGLSARSTNSVAIFAESTNSAGVFGVGHKEPGVSGTSDSSDGVRAVSNNGNGLSAFGGGDQGVGIFAQSSANSNKGKNTTAGFFNGDVGVNGHINGSQTTTIKCFDVSLIGQDCAEDFDVAEGDSVPSGTVMVINNEGRLQVCQGAYDRRVAGIVSGAGDYKPGITLGRRSSKTNRMPIALVGKVYCKADAQYGHINIGDLLTTSPTPGHAMKAEDPLQAFGSVIGKALCSLQEGQGLIPILVALQ